jgi:hypothetical protein
VTFEADITVGASACASGVTLFTFSFVVYVLVPVTVPQEDRREIEHNVPFKSVIVGGWVSEVVQEALEVISFSMERSHSILEVITDTLVDSWFQVIVMDGIVVVEDGNIRSIIIMSGDWISYLGPSAIDTEVWIGHVDEW